MEEEEKEQANEQHHAHNAEHHEKADEHKHHVEAPKEELKHHSAAPKKDNLQKVFLGLVIILGIALAINLVLTFSLNKSIGEKTEAAKEDAKPAKIELIVIKDSKCSDCYDIS